MYYYRTVGVFVSYFLKLPYTALSPPLKVVTDSSYIFCYRQVGINLGTPSHVSEHGIILLYRTGQLDPQYNFYCTFL
jgi:hypothetical protein